MSKTYGLHVPSKNKSKQPTFQASRNVFGNDSESDDDSNKKPILLKPSDNTHRQAKIAQNKAIVEDPTVFQYDEVYDEIRNAKEGKREKKKEDRKPKYIENLLKSASKRKIENERRMERQIQKERELEGEEFADKEVFVTSAYKKKLEEISLEEEREKREDYLESIGDVTKQADLGGFYRHLYEQKLGPVKKTENKTGNDDNSNCKQNTRDVGSNDEKNGHLKTQPNKDKVLESLKKRNYRKRKLSNDVKKLSDGEIDDSDEEINRLNLDDIRKTKKFKSSKENIDADSDFSIDESSDEAEEEKIDSHKIVPQEEFKKPDTSYTEKGTKATVDKEASKNIQVACEPKPKIDIWKKRTVGVVFEQALKRYYERKASRCG